MLEWYRALIRLRRATPDLADGRLDLVRVTADDEASTLVIERGAVTIVANLGTLDQKIDMRDRDTSLLLVSDPAVEVGSRTVSLPPDTVAVLGR
jgi:maltooligosyltrehalose trehalohydrolase